MTNHIYIKRGVSQRNSSFACIALAVPSSDRDEELSALKPVNMIEKNIAKIIK